MTKRFKLKVLPCVLLCAIVGVCYLQSWPRGQAEQWLEKHSQDVTSINISYGSVWSGSIWKYIDVSDKPSIRRIITSLRCKGSLTDTKMAKPDDGIMGYNTSYYLTFNYRDSQRSSERLVIHPSDRNGVFLLTRWDNRSMIGWAEMSSKQFANFNNTLKSVPGTRSATRH